jgi:hypothetical protein
MAFRPNYNRDRHERDRAARARSDEKQKKKMRKLRSAKLSATRPKLHQMTSRFNRQVRIMTVLGKDVVLASLSLRHGNRLISGSGMELRPSFTYQARSALP